MTGCNWGKWSEPGVPHRGWSCIDIEDWLDAGSLHEYCEMCGTCIRFAHVMEHPTYPDLLRVGCICAGNMEENVAKAKLREGEFKKRFARRSRWLKRAWRTSQKGNEYINYNGFNVVVFRRLGFWTAQITDRESGELATMPMLHATCEKAKLAAFDALEWVEGKNAARGAT